MHPLLNSFINNISTNIYYKNSHSTEMQKTKHFHLKSIKIDKNSRCPSLYTVHRNKNNSQPTQVRYRVHHNKEL